MTTPVLGLDEISASQSQKETSHNAALRQLETRLVRVLSKDVTTPPGSPSDGQAWIVPSGATGIWSGKTNQIAAYIGTGWVYWVPLEGARLWTNDLDIEYAFDGTNWIVTSGAGLTPPFADTTEIIKGSADATKKIRFEVDGLTTATTRVLTPQNRDGTLALTAPRISTVTWGASMTVDWSDKDVAFVTLAGNTTFTMSGAVAGQKCLLVLKQDGTGGRTASFGSEVRFGTDITGITLTTTANKQDKIGLVFNDDGATKYDVAAFTKGF